MEFKPDLNDQLVSLSALTVWFGHLACKKVPEMTYYVLSGTLSLYTIYLKHSSLLEDGTMVAQMACTVIG